MSPHTRSHLNGAVTEEGIVGKFQLFLLTVHNVDRVMQHHVGDPSGTLCHEDGHSRLTGLQKGEAADMILMGMGENRGANGSIRNLLQYRRRVVADLLGIHAAVEDHRALRKVEAITVGTDPGTPREIRKTHEREVYENVIGPSEGNLA